MRIQTFRASSIQEALQLVRESLGPDASVIKTRQVRPGLFSRKLVEIEASRDLTIPSRFHGGEALEDRNPAAISQEVTVGSPSIPLMNARSSGQADTNSTTPLPLTPRRFPGGRLKGPKLLFLIKIRVQNCRSGDVA